MTDKEAKLSPTRLTKQSMGRLLGTWLEPDEYIKDWEIDHDGDLIMTIYKIETTK